MKKPKVEPPIVLSPETDGMITPPKKVEPFINVEVIDIKDVRQRELSKVEKLVKCRIIEKGSDGEIVSDRITGYEWIPA